ncbi:MAG: transglutaminase domain-containing protein [Fimbriimonadaceae bacterium]|nr:transglutaminase domain-containing protein [Fimbriimonadaceae bacterium]
MARTITILRAVVFFGLTLVAAFVQAEETWLGLYIGADKLGYTYYDTTTAAGSRTPTKRVAKTVLTGRMLGQNLNISVDSTTTFTTKGDLDVQQFHMSSGGRVVNVTAKFTATTVEVETSDGGPKTKRTLPVPPGGVIKDDPTADLIEGQATTTTCYVFDPQTVSLVKTTLVRLPDEEIDTPQGKAKAHVVNVDDPRAPTKVYLSAKGDLIRAEGPFGMVMRPVTKAEALASADGDLTDIAEASTIPIDGDLGDWATAKSISFVFHGPKLDKVPSDAHQTVAKQGDDWLVEVHPVTWHDKTTTIAEAAKTMAQWTKPETHVPCDTSRFVELAKQVTGGEDRVAVAAEKVRQYVHGLVAANAGIGVVRDAGEILDSKEGVCRDHAVLMTTVLRAAGIPTRVCTGIVQYAGSFYYHAWVEVFDGTGWVALDSTRAPERVDATHIKTAQGSVADAFTSFILDRGRAKVVTK